MVPGRNLGCSCWDGEEISGSENQTHLEAAGLPGQVAAGVAVMPGPGGLPGHRPLPGVTSKAVHALGRPTP
jgi:hypothetical protein